MLSTCPKETKNQTLKNLCEDTDNTTSLDQVVPVSNTFINYRNKYCAFCNGVNWSEQTTWNAELYCDVQITENRQNLISTVIRRKCNIFYLPKLNTPIHACRQNIRFDKSSGCVKQVRGPTSTAKEGMIPRLPSCDLPPHPFSSTSVCLYCNTTEEYIDEEGEICMLPMYLGEGAMGDNITPSFFAILDIEAVDQDSVEERQRSCDPLTQFDDEVNVGTNSYSTPHIHTYIHTYIQTYIDVPRRTSDGKRTD